MGTGAVTGVGSADNGNITLPSARERIIQSVGAPVVTGERIPPVVGQDGGDEWMKECESTDRWSSKLDIHVYNLNRFRDWLFTRGIVKV